MRLDDFLLSLTVLLLERPEAEYPAARAAVLEDCAAYDLLQPRTPGRLSVGGTLADGRTVGLLPWIDATRGGAPVAAWVLHARPAPLPDIAEHQAAAFAGAIVQLLAVGARADGAPAARYVLQYQSSPEHAITPEQFLAWLDRQPHAAALREAARRELDDFNEMNQRPLIPGGDLDAWLPTPAGAWALDAASGMVLHGAQVRSRELGETLHLGPEDEALFVRRDPDDLERQYLAEHDPDAARAFIPSDERLSILEPLPGDALVDWVASLPCAEAAWARLHRVMKRSDPDRAPADPGGVPAHLRAMDPDALRMMGTMYLTAVQMACRLAGTELEVPEAMAGRVGTIVDSLDPEDRRVWIPEREQLHFAPNPAPWTLYCFEPQGPLAETPAPPDPPAARDRFRSALARAEAIADRMHSPFAEAFKLAAFVLDAEALSLATNPAADVAALGAAGFSELAQDAYGAKVGDLAILGRLGAAPAMQRALLACDLADVFGGMGSWNDQYPEAEADATEYQAASAELFGALRAFFVATLGPAA